jgi:hypothetical protein
MPTNQDRFRALRCIVAKFSLRPHSAVELAEAGGSVIAWRQILKQAFELWRVQDDGAARGTQAIDGLGFQCSANASTSR